MYNLSISLRILFIRFGKLPELAGNQLHTIPPLRRPDSISAHSDDKAKIFDTHLEATFTTNQINSDITLIVNYNDSDPIQFFTPS